MGMSYSHGPSADKQEMIAFLHAAVERGITFFDTAEVYGPFTNEELVGEALAPFRGQVVIATKFGNNLDPHTGANLGGLNSQPGHIKQAIEGSLKRLTATVGDAVGELLCFKILPGSPSPFYWGKGLGDRGNRVR